MGVHVKNTSGTSLGAARVRLELGCAPVRDLVIGEDVQAFDANLDNVASAWSVASDGDLTVPAGWAVNTTGGLGITAAGGTLLIEGTSASYDVDIESAARIDLRADDVISLDADSDINLDAGSSSDVFVRRGGSIYARFDGGNQGLCVGTHSSTRYATTSLDVRRGRERRVYLKVIIKFIRVDGRSGDRMIVCLCHGVSERQIEAHVESGAPTVREVGRRCGAGTDCGMCRSDIRSIVEAKRRGGRCGSPTVALSK